MSEALNRAIEAQANSGRYAQQPFDKEAWVEKKQEELKEAYTLIEMAVNHTFSNDGSYKAALDILAQMPDKSAGNVLLITSQLPEATRVETFEEWSKQGVSIKAGERGLHTLALAPYKGTDEQDKMGFRVVAGFDISQTDAKPVTPKQPSYDLGKLISALVKASPVKIITDDTLDRDAAYSEKEREIRIHPALGENNEFLALSREIARANISVNREGAAYDLPQMSAAYILGKRLGVDVSGLQFKDMPAAAKELYAPKELQKMLNEANHASKMMYNDISQTLEKARENAQER